MIGIITFHFAYNYGAVLQAYALNEYINKNIGECKIINYRPQLIEENYHIKTKAILRNPKLIFVKLRRKHQDMLFNEFVLSNFKCDNKNVNPVEVANKYEYLITGSDQVWNISLTHNDLNYFLKFAGPEAKRIAYGASIGNSGMVQEYSDQILREIRKFNFISCREESAVNAIRSIVDYPVQPVVDPTFLLPETAWLNLCRRPEGEFPQKFILYYALTESKELIDKAEAISKSQNLPILSIHPMAKKWKIAGRNLNNIGPSEFLWLIKNAEYVCTNSFHGSVFSVVFRKKCVLVAHEKLGERNKQLLDWMALDQESFGKEINFAKSDYAKLNFQINNSKAFLDKALR